MRRCMRGCRPPARPRRRLSSSSLTGCARRSPERGWELEEQHVYRDDGYSGASLGRPGLDRLRDHAALAELDVVLVTAPDRLARNYVHQVLLIDELAGHGCQVEFLDRPMSADRTTSCCCRSAGRSPSTSAR